MVRVKRVANQIREAFEKIATQEGGSSDLCGFCDRASVQLFLAAKRHNIDGVKIVCGWGHVYNIYDGYVVDVTATQFDHSFDSVHVVPFQKDLMRYAWEIQSGPHDSIVDFVKNSAWVLPWNIQNDFVSVFTRDTSFDPFQEYPYDNE